MNIRRPYIAHFDLDSFFVSVELLLNPELKGKPVIVGGSANRGVVSTCSYEARKFGVQSAMPMKTAMKLCPEAILLKGTHQQYGYYSQQVTDLVAAKVPLFQKASIDEFYCDLSGMERYFDISKYTRELREYIIKETGLPISCGLSTAKFISKMATNEAKPNGFLEVPFGKEKDFLWPLGIEKINGIGKQTEPRLRAIGLHTIRDIAHTPVEILEKKLGKWGRILWNKSHGIGSAEIETEWNQKSMSHETTFHENQTNLEFLHSQLVRLIEKNAFDLRKDQKLTGCLTIKVRYSNFETISKQETIPITALDDELILKAKDIFDKCYQPDRPVRLIGVRFSQLVDSGLQMTLFGDQTAKLNLYKAVDDIKTRFGNQLVSKAVVKQKNKKDDA
ncbi:MAG TPA: DNA polymerase IV [Niabella sp.]|nr:DNA polymerase IV [Niabella sp.]HOZ96807.1 DNA polymerase IV [Niabella sp.]HQW14716.1 DNA polymerase IV [Niabella sp.]HQX20032.1 DNA polymerase IV [Niabella sp.]HQX40652.1 DNA polymerase IV [Niabella sp.]